MKIVSRWETFMLEITQRIKKFSIIISLFFFAIKDPVTVAIKSDLSQNGSIFALR